MTHIHGLDVSLQAITALVELGDALADAGVDLRTMGNAEAIARLRELQSLIGIREPQALRTCPRPTRKDGTRRYDSKPATARRCG